MPELMILCPNKGKEIATGIEIAANEPRKAARLLIRCPHCGILHGCAPSDGYVKNAPAGTPHSADTPADDDATVSHWVVEA